VAVRCRIVAAGNLVYGRIRTCTATLALSTAIDTRVLADLPEGDLAEVNSGVPVAAGFAALKAAMPFFFKTHTPHNRAVGGGFFSRSPAADFRGMGHNRARE
jgi:hypothetical protein